jgi:translation initiation factor IF-1
MPGKNAFSVEGVVVRALPNGTYRVRLANGHQLLAYVAGKARLTAPPFSPGAKVNLDLSPCDLSEGRILLENRTN